PKRWSGPLTGACPRTGTLTGTGPLPTWSASSLILKGRVEPCSAGAAEDHSRQECPPDLLTVFDLPFGQVSRMSPNPPCLPLVYGDRIWSMLRQGSKRRLRSYLIHRLGHVPINGETFLQQYPAEEDVSAKRALLQILGGFSELKPAQREKLVPQLLRDY